MSQTAEKIQKILLHMSQLALAKRLGITQGSLSQLASGKTTPDARTCLPLAGIAAELSPEDVTYWHQQSGLTQEALENGNYIFDSLDKSEGVSYYNYMNYTHETSRYEDDSDVIDIIEEAKAEWFAEHAECSTPTSEETDARINKQLGLPVCGSIRGLALDLADCSPDEIKGDVKIGLDSWYRTVEP